MKKLFKNKRLISGLVALMLGVAILVMSLSFAWFFDEDEDESPGIITIGSLKIHAKLVDPDNPDNGLVPDPQQSYPETTRYHDQIGKVWSTGSIDAMVQVNFEIDYPAGYSAMNYDLPPVKFTFKDGGVPAPTAADEAKAWPLCVWIGVDDDGETLATYAWYEGADGKYYVSMLGAGTPDYANDVLHFGYDIDFPEPDFDNGLWNKQGDPFSFIVRLTAKGVQLLPLQAQVDYFNSIRDSSVPELVEGPAFVETNSGAKYFNLVNPAILVINVDSEELEYGFYPSPYAPFDPGYDTIWPEGVVSPFSASDIHVVAKLIQGLPECQLKADLAAVYGVSIG